MDRGEYERRKIALGGTSEIKDLKGNSQRATRLIFQDGIILPFFLILLFLDLPTLDIIFWLISLKKEDLAHCISPTIVFLLSLPKFEGYVSILLLLLDFFLILNTKTSILVFFVPSPLGTSEFHFSSLAAKRSILAPLPSLLCCQGCNVLFYNCI